MEAYNLIILELLVSLIVKSVKLAVQDEALQKIGYKLRDTKMLGFFKNPFIPATSDVMVLRFFLSFFLMV